jgi:hypothetical protein
MIAAGIVAAIVVLAAITTVFLMTKMGGGGNPAGGLTPEDTLNALITAMNSKDANGVLSLTVFSFGDATMKSQFRVNLTKLFNSAGASFHVTLNSHQVKYPTDLNASENSNLTGIKNQIESHISKTITASCMIVFNMTIMTNQSDFYQDGMMPCFQIDGGWYILMDFGNGGPGPGGNQSVSPTDAFDSFIDRVKQKDETGAVDYTIFSFANNSVRMQVGGNISKMWQNTGTFQVTVNSRSEINWTSMSFDQRNNLSGIQSNLPSKFGINVPVQESCFIGYDITITNDSGSNTTTGFMPCFRVNNSWYVMPEQPGYNVTISVTHPGAFYILTVDSITGAGSSININDVYITVRYANSTLALGHMQLSMMPVGSSINGTEFVEVSGPGTLDAGDYFSLDDTMFGPGTDLILENAMGTQKYRHITI